MHAESGITVGKQVGGRSFTSTAAFFGAEQSSLMIANGILDDRAQPSQSLFVGAAGEIGLSLPSLQQRLLNDIRRIQATSQTGGQFTVRDDLQPRA